MLRPYQQDAADAGIAWMKSSTAPGLIEAATGAGKSHIIAEIAEHIHFLTGKKVLCLAPSSELVVQNRNKYLASGHRASMFSASAGGKDLRHPVVFGSPLTVKNAISRFKGEGQNGYALVIVDEAHGITPTIREIIEAMRAGNPNLRVLGLTATPYRLGDGYIFSQWPDGSVNGDLQARNPYFEKCVFSIGAHSLIDAGFLTPPVIGAVMVEGYDTSGLTANARGQFDSEAVDRAYHGHGRKTAAIVADVVAQSAGRKGVIFYAATVRHAQEVLASLPPDISAIVTGDTPKRNRDRILGAFLSMRIKYLVNVAVLTTGFDAPHVDVIAILRKTESVGLLQQIVGRGLRLFPGKTDCLILDYTTNIDDHCPDGDLFDPKIKAGKPKRDGGEVTCVCPECQTENLFSAVENKAGYDIDENGYFIDLDGTRVETEWGPMPAHFGRRCFGRIKVPPRGEYERCGYRWTYKECPQCETPNDIAARYCCNCKAEIVDPNEKLRGEFKALKRDPTRLQTDAVTSISGTEGVSQKGNKTLRLDIVTPYRQFAVWLQPEATHSKGMRDWMNYCRVTYEGAVPASVTYRKNADTGFYEVLDWNREPDYAPE